uniref:Cytochrome p450 n=1 Tax=Moniliophthora roreri TaxID=221103 RepID=A0A0W0GF85_MONRR
MALQFLVLTLERYVYVFTLSTTLRLSITIFLALFLVVAGWTLNSIIIRSKAYRSGAILPPSVKESSFTIPSKILESFKNGYPGASAFRLPSYTSGIINSKLPHVGDAFLEWHQQYGNIYTANIFSEIRIFTMEPTHVKAILATQFNDFEKGPFQYQQWHTLLGSGVFNSDGETWKFHRAMTRPFFNKDRVTDYDIFDRHAVRVISRMKSRLEENQAVDVQDAFGRFTLDSASEFLFGKDVQSIGAGLPYSPASGIPNPASFTNHPSTKFVKAFMKAQGKTLSRSRTGKLWPLYEFWKDLVMPERDVLDSFLIPVLLDARDRKKGRLHEGTNDAQNHQTLLDHLVDTVEGK